MQYWGLEKIYEQFRSDLQGAVYERIAWLEHTRPGEGVSGEVIVESRVCSLNGLLAYLKRADAEVRRGVLSPETVELWKNIGIDVFSDAS